MKTIKKMYAIALGLFLIFTFFWWCTPKFVSERLRPRLKSNFPFIYYIYYQSYLRSELSWKNTKVKKEFEVYLTQKYQRKFIVERPFLIGDMWGVGYRAYASPETDPQMRFRIKSEFYMFSKDDYKIKDKEAISDDFMSINRKIRSENLEKLLLEAGFSSTSIFIIFINGTNKEYKELNLDKIRAEFKPVGSAPDACIFIKIRIDRKKFQRAIEAGKLAKVLNQFFRKNKFSRYIVCVNYQDRKVEIPYLEQIGPKGEVLNYREKLENCNKKGYLLHSFLLFSFENSGNTLTKDLILKSQFF